ncbi:MAG: response regulator [Pedosphaera sp.]|nr:response regulator [Pedosphaera sp.]
MLQHTSILLVEDDPSDEESFRRIAVQVYPLATIHTATSVGEATKYCEGRAQYADRKLYPVPAIVFVDLALPDASGSELIKWLRKQPQYQKLLIVVFTGSGDLRQLSSIYSWGADSFLLKTSESKELLSSLQELNGYWIQRGFLQPLPPGYQPPR